MKKIKSTVAILGVTTLALTLTPLTAFAHGHGHGGARRAAQVYSLCNVANCDTVGTHKHNNTHYYGHSLNDGHDYHQLCDINDCAIVGNHQHDGETYFGHHIGDGHAYHNTEHNGYYHH